MAEIVSMNGQQLPDPKKPVQSVIEELEKILERARSGESMGVVVCELNRDNTINMSLVGQVSYSMMGGLYALAYRVNEHMGAWNTKGDGDGG